eukprot:GFUD01113320.1.p1 GENE.GFUD01113320.1~~GFUD01113320.1.p1  ORF type:complete len:134 (+),score=38.30 GFUD01113320.1:30-431(+)
MGIFHSRIKSPDVLEDFSYKTFPVFPPVQPPDRQGTEDSSLPATLATIAAAFLLANVLLAVALQPDRPKLEDDAMCGMTTGGKAECYFDCETTYNRRNPTLRLIKNLTCLLDCFEDEDGEECIGKLLEDIIAK